jgi:hypothetical protein
MPGNNQWSQFNEGPVMLILNCYMMKDYLSRTFISYVLQSDHCLRSLTTGGDLSGFEKTTDAKFLIIKYFRCSQVLCADLRLKLLFLMS